MVAVRCTLVCVVGLLPLVVLPSAYADGLGDTRDQWLPRSDGARWTYQWRNSRHAPTLRRESYRVAARSGTLFRLRWDGLGLGPFDPPNVGTIDFQHTDAGLVTRDWATTPPPSAFPILCPSPSRCGNSLASAMYLVIWGARSPTLAEPLVRGTRWNSLGGVENDVASASRYVGRRRVVVPAFPNGVRAAAVESEITQAGALGDPFGSGVRIVDWVRGVGPVAVTLNHADGSVSRATLASTNQRPMALPSDANLLPLNRGDRATFRWRNSRHMRRWSKQRFRVTGVVNNTARVRVGSLGRGPISVKGAYAFAVRLSGVTHLSGFTRARTRARFPRLGPRGASRDRRRRFLTPYDLMVYGFNPVLPAYPVRGETWRSSRESPAWRVFGVRGRSKVIGIRRVRTRAGRFRAIVVRSTLRQRGFRFGSGTRTSWFAPNRGLVKLVFRHRDGSVSRVERLRR